MSTDICCGLATSTIVGRLVLSWFPICPLRKGCKMVVWVFISVNRNSTGSPQFEFLSFLHYPGMCDMHSVCSCSETITCSQKSRFSVHTLFTGSYSHNNTMLCCWFKSMNWLNLSSTANALIHKHSRSRVYWTMGKDTHSVPQNTRTAHYSRPWQLKKVESRKNSYQPTQENTVNIATFLEKSILQLLCQLTWNSAFCLFFCKTETPNQNDFHSQS